MTLLDRFRTQARHRHPDPAVRLAYVDEIPIDERDVIASIAREDEDPRVRRAAVAKLMDAAALGAIARDDRDETVRGQAAEMLRDLALEAFEGVEEAESLEAIDGLTDNRVLAQIAKTAGREIVALRALSRISDTHVLGSIARHATSEAARRGAFERLRGDRGEILGIAMNSEYKDTALAAMDLVTDRAELEQIAARGKNKNAVKRARGTIREADERAAREAAEAAALASTQDAPLHPTEIAGARTSEDLEASAPPNASDVVAPADRARAEEEAVARQRADEAAATRREAAEPSEAERAAAAEEARRQAERRELRLAELVDAGVAAAADPDLASARKRFGLTRREWTDLVDGVSVDAALASRFADAESQITARQIEAREADARARREALGRLSHLLGRVESLAAKPDLSLKAADRALRDVRTALTGVPPLPSKQDYDEVLRRLKAAQATLMPKLQELREAAEWQRWANVGIQEELCAKMEALRALDDPEATARQVRELQQQWRQAADVPPAKADALWLRFKAAHDEAWARCETHFVAQAQARAENLARKMALCEKAESMADSTSWIQTAEELKHLQAEWKTIGPVSHGREKAIWDRFRAACDRFFTRRHDDLSKRKTVWAGNLAKKEALIASAEALAESNDWDRAAVQLRRLQAEWRAIGPVKKNRSEAIWQRFRTACDRFFTRHAQRHDVARAERVAAREAICAELEALASPAPPSADSETAGQPPASETAPPSDLIAQVRALRSRWQQEIATRGVDPARAHALDGRFAAASAAVLARWPAVFSGTDLDPDANRKRMEALVRRIESLAASLGGASATAGADDSLSPTTRLAAMLKEALAANTIGGKVEDDSRWRAAAEEVRQAQASFARIGPVPDEMRRALTDRFQSATRKILDRQERAGGAGKMAGGAGGAGKAGWPGGAGKAGR